MGHLSRIGPGSPKEAIGLAGLVLGATLILFSVYDLAHHMIEDGGITLHSALESLFLSFLAGAIFLYGTSTKRQVLHSASELHLLRAELQQFRARNGEVVSEFRDAVYEQFQRWGLSTGEQMVAEKLIQGFSFREIAAQLGKKEKTVRNQSQSLYDKAGMTGRHDLAAFFLQDILGCPD